jgi:hypothetical protein
VCSRDCHWQQASNRPVNGYAEGSSFVKQNVRVLQREAEAIKRVIFCQTKRACALIGELQV